MATCVRCGSIYTKDQEFCGLDGERLIAGDVDPLIGRTIDRYRILSAIGDGGMARVYRARHIYLEQDFAIKVLYGEIASDRNLARRFQREAQAVSKIKHKNVVSIIDFGTTAEGLIFMAMELLVGRTLGDAIKEDGPYSPPRAAELIRQIADGLRAAHSLGFVHRDLKPKNVMLVPDDSAGSFSAKAVEIPKILDFGLVFLTGGASGDATSLTRQGQVFGTPAYMAPEQVMGREVDARADLYALGVILYQMLSGQVPFQGSVAEVAAAHLAREAPRLPHHGGLGPIVQRLLSKNPEARPLTAAELIESIDRLELGPAHASHVSDGAHRAERAERSERSERRHVSTFVAPRDDFSPSRSDSALPAISTRIDHGPIDRGALIDRTSSDVSRGEALRGPRYGWWAVFAIALAAGGGVLAYRSGVIASAPFNAPPAPAPAAEAPKPPPPTPAAQKPASAPGPAPEELKPALPAPPPAQPSVEPAPKIAVPAVRPKPQSTHEEHGAVQSFAALDRNLAALLARRGLNWHDVAGVIPDAVEQWELWRIGADPPGGADLEAAARILAHAIDRMRIDRRLLLAKLQRAHEAILQLPPAAQGDLEARYQAIEKRLQNAPKGSEPTGLAGDIAALETAATSRGPGAEKSPSEGGAHAPEQPAPATPGKESPDPEPSIPLGPSSLEENAPNDGTAPITPPH